MTYLERYLQGDCVQVWADLMNLGPRVREEPTLSDARAVAEETMRRVRRNIEMLAERLRQIGYWFALPAQALEGPFPDLINALHEFEGAVGPVPLSVAAWIEIVGRVDFVGSYPRLCYCAGTLDIAEEDQVLSDPLVISFDGIDAEYYADCTAEYEEDLPFAASVAPDDLSKANYSGDGPHEMPLPDANADGLIEGKPFVEYLRNVFRWGGFPGLAEYERRDPDLIARLTEGLLPI